MKTASDFSEAVFIYFRTQSKLIVCRLIVFVRGMINLGDNMDIIKVFGTNVKSRRLQMGLSQDKLAERSGLHRTYISDIERFTRSISLENIQRLADALEIETFTLFIEKKED